MVFDFISVPDQGRLNRLAFFTVIVFAMTTVPGAGEDAGNASQWKKYEFSGKPLSGLRVALDVGHSKATLGATSARGRGEFHFNLDTTRVLAGVLTKAGAHVILVNEEGTMRGLLDRAVVAGKQKADLFISVHHDAVNNKYLKKWNHEGVTRDYSDNFRGYSVFTSSKNSNAEASRKLALGIGEALYASGLRPTLHHAEPIQGENRPLLDERTGVYEFTDLVVLKSTAMPAILLECGVIVHREEELLVQEPAYQELIAHALVKALEPFSPGKPSGGIRRLFGPK